MPPLKGVRVLITAGATREFIDPVRFISNPSTGKMGIALAQEACRLGARVTLLVGSSVSEDWLRSLQQKIRLFKFVNATDLQKLMRRHCSKNKMVIMTAAVGDWQVVSYSSQKIKRKTAWSLKLKPTPDILKECVAKRRRGQLIIGFAAETNRLRQNGLQKIKSKQCDLLIVNPVGKPGAGFGSETNEALVLSQKRPPLVFKRQSKRRLAAGILKEIYSHYENNYQT